MTRIGEFGSALNGLILTDTDIDEITGTVSTTSATLEDITGLTFDVTVPTGMPSTARILVLMTVQCSATAAGATGGWAVNINGTDKQELQRYLSSGGTDVGVLMVVGRTTGLSAGNYTVKGRHRRVSGSGTVNSDVAQLVALVTME